MDNRIVQIILGVVILAVIALFYQYSRDFVAGAYETQWYKYYEVSPYTVRLLVPLPFVAGIGYYLYRRLRCRKQKS